MHNRWFWSPAGTFVMGSPATEAGRDSDEVQHQVTLTRSFYVCRCEVTQGEWQKRMGWNESNYGGADRPVDEVTWYDAVLFCNRRSAAEGLAPAYSIAIMRWSGNHLTLAGVEWNTQAPGYRLPTEAEWEYACRAGSRTAYANGEVPEDMLLGRECDSDSVLDAIGWYRGNAWDGAGPVGRKMPNAWGLHDMHGNAWEWCWDWAAAYPAGPATDPGGPSTGTHRIRRSGSWEECARRCRSAYRHYGAPDYHYREYGLRVVRNGP
jgi:formylglycine-generating enzyme required for sulfatase activity